MIPVPHGVTLSATQTDLLASYADELAAMNRRINLVSRDDVTRISSHHIPHCLALAVRRFPDRAVVADWGTGGGLPLIPLAIAMPEVRFVGVDAVEKKVQAVRHFARRLGLDNVEAWHGRAENYPGLIDHSISRATAPLATLWSWHSRVCEEARSSTNGWMDGEAWPRGLICLKGGELSDEISQLPAGLHIERLPLTPLLPEEYFATKEILCVTVRTELDGQS